MKRINFPRTPYFNVGDMLASRTPLNKNGRLFISPLCVQKMLPNIEIGGAGEIGASHNFSDGRYFITTRNETIRFYLKKTCKLNVRAETNSVHCQHFGIASIKSLSSFRVR